MPRIKSAGDNWLVFKCPGCSYTHHMRVRTATAEVIHPSWIFNGDYDRPTLQPSILFSLDWPEGKEICHSFVKNGKIEFLPDCTHALAGKTLDLPDIHMPEM